MNSALLAWAALAVIGFVYLASSTAFNALISCNVILMNISFGLPIGLMLFGRRKYMKPTTFPLGNILGPIINTAALSWILFVTVFFNFPFTMPARVDNISKFSPQIYPWAFKYVRQLTRLLYPRLLQRDSRHRNNIYRCILGCKGP